MGYGWKNPLKTVQEVAQATTEKANSILTGGTNAVNNAGSTAGKGYKGIAEQVAAALEKQKEGIRLAMEQAQAAAKDPAGYADDTKDSIVENVTEVAKDNNLDKPGGTVEVITDAMNPNNSIEGQVDTVADAVQPLIDETSVVFDTLGDATDLSGLDEETLTDATLLTENDAGYQEQEEEFLTGTRRNKQTGENRSRIMANQTQGKSASLLTG
jgi:phenylpyruvate tautomerase PptA (4-oxalocrotonate tautomerase family)